ATRSGGKNTVIAAVVGVMQMLAGAPEIILFTWTIALLIVLSQSFRAALPARVSLQRLVTVAALVTGLAAIQLLPFIDLLAHSHRDASQANTACAMPITGWANLLVPLFRCTSSPPGLFFQPGQFWTYSYYLSLAVVAAALCSV